MRRNKRTEIEQEEQRQQRIQMRARHQNDIDASNCCFCVVSLILAIMLMMAFLIYQQDQTRTCISVLPGELCKVSPHCAYQTKISKKQGQRFSRSIYESKCILRSKEDDDQFARDKWSSDFDDKIKKGIDSVFGGSWFGEKLQEFFRSVIEDNSSGSSKITYEYDDAAYLQFEIVKFTWHQTWFYGIAGLVFCIWFCTLIGLEDQTKYI
ncbi:hypothetical protein FGO68_gene14457 [Halteria grandinella]|uniref:Transmembrane protein n=1 Tax=Halteria grandinella TaxID=5974 RepID=A0A8J8SYN7_HALGN|nr:hypothetical protein FGO68_gene14457 [Halteria grandinella]